MMDANAYCKTLGIKVPCLEDVRSNPEANFYSLLIVALLERGGPLTLEEAARRFEQAGVAPAAAALASLRRCKPGRPPIFRNGESYALDPYDDETDLWVFRLGLRPRSFQMIQVVRPDPGPLPSLEAPLSVADLEEAWQGGVPAGWSAQRIAICVLDAHDAVMRADEALTFLKAFGPWSLLSIDSARFWRGNGPIRVRESGIGSLIVSMMPSDPRVWQFGYAWRSGASRRSTGPILSPWPRTKNVSNANVRRMPRSWLGCVASSCTPSQPGRRKWLSCWMSADAK